MIFILVSALIFLSIEARFTFILNIKSHSTTSSCDLFLTSECDTYFSLFCLRGSSAQQSSNTGYCPLGANRKRLEQQTGTRNISSNQPWPVTFQLFIQAWDEDDITSDDLLDNIFIEDSLINSDLSQMTVTGSMFRVTMTVQFRRVCDENYYDVSCSTHCIAADDDTTGHYTCNPNNGSKQCLPGYEGFNCTENSDDCIPNPCENAGNCTDLLLDFTCECPPGYTGKNCSIDIDECAENFCPGNSTCEDHVNGYTCSCNYGYTGENCTQDPCEPSPCVNGGTCEAVDSSAVNSSTSMCVCPAGYAGPVCELNIDNCLNASCPLGTSCLDGNNTYECVSSDSGNTTDNPSNQRTDNPSNQRTDNPSNQRTDNSSNQRTDNSSNQQTDNPNNQRTDNPSNQRRNSGRFAAGVVAGVLALLIVLATCLLVAASAIYGGIRALRSKYNWKSKGSVRLKSLPLEEVEINPNPLYGRDDITMSSSTPTMDGVYHKYDNSLYCLATGSHNSSSHSANNGRLVKYESIENKYEEIKMVPAEVNGMDGNENLRDKINPDSPHYHVPRPFHDNKTPPQGPLSSVSSPTAPDYEFMADLVPIDNDNSMEDQVYESISDHPQGCKENCPLIRQPRLEDKDYSVVPVANTDGYNKLTYGRASGSHCQEMDDLDDLYYS